MKVYRRSIEARSAGVPIARDMGPVYKAMLHIDAKTPDDNTPGSPVWVLQSENHSAGFFFQLSKGHFKSLVAEINKDRDKGAHTRAVRAFEAAKAFKITDPQGFYDVTLDMPIRFIDIHTETTAIPIYDDIISALKEPDQATS